MYLDNGEAGYLRVSYSVQRGGRLGGGKSPAGKLPAVKLAVNYYVAAEAGAQGILDRSALDRFARENVGVYNIVSFCLKISAAVVLPAPV